MKNCRDVPCIILTAGIPCLCTFCILLFFIFDDFYTCFCYFFVVLLNAVSIYYSTKRTISSPLPSINATVCQGLNMQNYTLELGPEFAIPINHKDKVVSPTSE